MYRLRLVPILFATLAGCEDRPRRATPTATSEPTAEVTRWARAVDSLSTGMSPRDFGFPSRSTEGGTGRFFRLADSSIRIDIEDFGEIGKHRERYYARDEVLRLAVSSNDRYDSPMSGRIIRSAVDSVWFEGDSAVRWVDSVQVVRAGTDSAVKAYGTKVRAQFLWAVRMAGTKPAPNPQR